MAQPTPHLLNRRSFLSDMSTGLGGVALASLLQADRLLAADKTPNRPRIDSAA
ncbi:MAG: hypothetical protein ACI8QF_001929, partial [Limisphaerales bacterium]